MNHDIERALGRSEEIWSYDNTHTQNEAAYLDRAVLAHEVMRLLDAVAQAYSEAVDAYGEALTAWTQLTDRQEKS